MVAAVKGYKLLAMPESMSIEERRRLMSLHGAEFVLRMPEKSG
jgi:cysteine synthase A